MEYDHEALESQHFETLKPGSSVKRIINIASAHDLEAGTYTILADGSVFAAEKKSTLSYKSNTITVSIKEPSTAEIRETLEKRTVFDGADCTDEQRTATANGIKNCEKLARAAAADVIDPKSTRVFEYFKTNSSETRALLNHRFLRVADECSRTDAGDTHVLCTDMYGECTANGPLIAYTVWVNGYVTLCPMFYETRPPLPEACHKQDHATTLIHEMTHARAVFEPDVATQDLAYSYENVTKLDTDHALNNADSYSLYANGKQMLSTSFAGLNTDELLAVYMNC